MILLDPLNTAQSSGVCGKPDRGRNVRDNPRIGKYAEGHYTAAVKYAGYK
jgi:hypothetical protein